MTKTTAHNARKRLRSKAQPKPKAPAKMGRPTKYDPSMCEQVIEFGKQGMSLTEIADNLDTARARLDDWATQHRDFRTALTRALTAAEAWWEREGRENRGNPQFNAHLWVKTMQARFRNNYTERRELAVSGTVTHEQRIKALADLDADLIDVTPGSDDAGMDDEERQQPAIAAPQPGASSPKPLN